MNKEDRFKVTFKHLIRACRNGNLSYEIRKNNYKDNDPIAFTLSKFKIFGFFFYLMFGILRRKIVQLYRKGFIDDHASNVIKNSLIRADILKEKENIVNITTSRWSSLISFVYLFPSVFNAFRNVRPINDVEFYRIANTALNIFHFYYLFKKIKPKYVLIADTNSHSRLALGVVSNICEVPVFVFSVVKKKLREPSPFDVHTYFCWTKSQKNNYEYFTNSNAVIMGTKITNKFKVPIKTPNSRVGILLNAKFRKDEIQKLILQLNKFEHIEEIYIRPHPGKLFNEEFKHGIVKSWKEPIENYLESVDCVFAPNTNALTEAILQGIPVVYVQNLGEGIYDQHSMVEKGVVLPFSDKEFEYPETINNFYLSNKTCKALKSFYSEYTNNSKEKYILKDIINNYKYASKCIN